MSSTDGNRRGCKMFISPSTSWNGRVQAQVVMSEIQSDAYGFERINAFSKIAYTS